MDISNYHQTRIRNHCEAFSYNQKLSTMSTSKLLVVFGATGQQGSSLIDTVLADPDLKSQYSIRALTRDPTQAAAQALQQKGIEVAAADLDNSISLGKALDGAHTVYGVTTTPLTENAKADEIKQGKLLADAVVASGAKFYIFSSMTHALKVSGSPVDIFDSKAEVEDYIRTLPIKSAFFAPGTFMQNWFTQALPRPTEEPGVYAFANIIRPDVPVPMIDTAGDTGKYIAPILAEPEKYAGKVMYAASGLWTFTQVAEAISKASGKTVKYKQIPVDVFKGFLPPHTAPLLVQMNQLIDDPGYFGPQTKELVEWTLKQMKEKPTSFEEFLEKNPLPMV